MKPNINNLSKVDELIRILDEKKVSASTIDTLKKSIKSGMLVKNISDLNHLNLPVSDLEIVKEAISIGPRIEIVPNLKRIQILFEARDNSQLQIFGYQLVVRYLNKSNYIVEQSFPIEENMVLFDIDLNDVLTNSNATIKIKNPSGAFLNFSKTNTGDLISRQDVKAIDLTNETLFIQLDELSEVKNPAFEKSYQIRGKLFSGERGKKLEGYNILIQAAASKDSSGALLFENVTFATSETNGYFLTDFLHFTNKENQNKVIEARAIVVKDHQTSSHPITLAVTNSENGVSTSMLPDRLIIFLDNAVEEEEDSCGCKDLNFHEKKVFEEFSYYSIVRTTEPALISESLEDDITVDLSDTFDINIRVPLNVFKKFAALQTKQPVQSVRTNVPFFTNNIVAASTNAGISENISRTIATDISKANFNLKQYNIGLLERLMQQNDVNKIIKGSQKASFKGRSHLNQMNQIDWDEDPTVYQAASVAHGHILHFKQEWTPDGYSIGDLVYSLPLAPGQKKQIAVLDWERRESASNSQFLDYEESLNNTLVRDRDVREVVNVTLAENIRATSRANTSSFGGGAGGGILGAFTGGVFGAVAGISGGRSSSSSDASQSATRDSAANSLQQIRDRTSQAANVVRSQRATVVQTVSQGEKVQATSESVANYNHCHAITIQYFEVLRHFNIANRLADVQECLFVPLQISPFDIDKVIRWRNILEMHLYRRDLLPGFDAITRIANEKESLFEDYYASIGFPVRNYAEQPVTFYVGELYMDFYFFNTKQDGIPDELEAFFKIFGISLDQFRDRPVTSEELAAHVGPRSIEYLLDTMVITTDRGADLRFDFTLISSFRQAQTLRISIRQSASTPKNIPREMIQSLNVRFDLSRISSQVDRDALSQFQNKFMKIRLRSGNLRYRTSNLSGVLFNGRIDNDIFPGSDGAYLDCSAFTPEEMRNPRGEDVNFANNLLHHLNENLEHYHKCLFFEMTPERRFMLLDGIIAPGKAAGRSVASVVENRIIGVAGNSIIMPVAKGYQLDPTINDKFDLFANYFTTDSEPMRVSMPTKGIFAEAVMGKCNSCEAKDETRFWRWEESPIPDSPTTPILPINTDTRRADPGNLQPKDFPAPVVNIQNAPTLPDPQGLAQALQLLGKGDAFRDLTGLNQNQLNALEAFKKTLDTAQQFGSDAADLAKTAATLKMTQDAQKSGTITNEDARKIANKTIDPEEAAKTNVKNRENEREQTKKDVEVVQEQKENGNLDDEQAKELTEDKIRKDQGTTKTPAPAKPKGKKKYNVTFILKDYEGRPLTGTFVINYGSLVDETVEVTTSSVKTFEIELDRNKENILEVKGNPFITGVSFPGNPEYYFHFTEVPTVVGTGKNLTFIINQTRTQRSIEVAEGTSESKVIEDATARELSISSAPTAEVDLIIAKFGGTISITGTRTKTHSESTETGTTETRTEVYDYKVPARRLKVQQKGIESDDISLEE